MNLLFTVDAKDIDNSDNKYNRFKTNDACHNVVHCQISLFSNIAYYSRLAITNTIWKICSTSYSIVNILYDTQPIVYNYFINIGHTIYAYNCYFQCVSMILSMYIHHCHKIINNNT